MPPHDQQALLEAHRGMLIDGLTSIFGAFDQQMLQHVLPRVEWIELGGGERLFAEGEFDDSLFFVVSGRLRATSVDAEGRRFVLGEIARGETVGEMAFFTGEPRSATVTAVRDSVLARFSNPVFRELLTAYPLVSLNMMRLVIERLRRMNRRHEATAKPITIGVAAISDRVDQHAVAAQLAEVLLRYGRTATVDAQVLDRALGAPGAAQVPVTEAGLSRRVALWMEQIESEHRFVLFVADDGPTGWTQRCLRHCDELLLLADADRPPKRHPIEIEGLDLPGQAYNQASRTLVLLHPDDRRSPTGTRQWLDGRHLTGHVHLRRGLDRDWQRLGRMLGGHTVGLVLSGGGARGFAHLGVLKALEEARIDCDLVGGTSIGAVMAAFAAMDLPAAEAIEAARTAFRGNPTADFNLIPLLSLIGGRRLRHVIDTAVVASRGQHIDIEDLWKGFFCISSNYSAARETVLTRGHLAKSIRASVSIPGALPPVALDGDLHIDGGTFNNFPVDVMARSGAAHLVGVNLLRERTDKVEFEEMPGWFDLLRDRLRGAESRRYRLPTLTTLLLNTSTMYSYARQQAAQEQVDLYFAPRVDGFGMLEWGQFERIVDAGYRHASEQLARADGALLALLRHPETGPGGEADPVWAHSTSRMPRRR